MAVAKKEILLLFDMNGVLSFKVPTKRGSAAHYHFYPRPGVVEFLTRMGEEFSLGIFSSTKIRNIRELLLQIYPSGDPFLFIADRGSNLLNPLYGEPAYPEVKPWDTIKVLSSGIWGSPIFNADRHWGPHNTLLIEHDPDKVLFNPRDNVVLVPEYRREAGDRSLQHLERLIRGGVATLTEGK